MITRNLEPVLHRHARSFPVVTLTGPRQAGKSTLCRAAFPEHEYVSLEAPDLRAFAERDPRGFLEQYPGPAVFDEVQRVPELFSYLQVVVDEAPSPGRFVLTGSADLALLGSISQSLAGRTSVARLLPCSYDELLRFPEPPSDVWKTVWMGAFPAVFDRRVPPGDWFRAYITTYLERDVRQLLRVADLTAFQLFLELAASRAGQLLNLSQLGADVGVSHNTARAWLSVLEAGLIAWRLRPFATSLSTRVVKTPKLYFFDTGLVCALLGITEPRQLARHPLRGAIFENWVVAETLKARLHRGLEPGLYFLRDRKGFEIDLLLRTGERLVAVEIKSGQTSASDFFRPLERLPDKLPAELAHLELDRFVVYGGTTAERRGPVRLVPWFDVPSLPLE
ncbi:MAG: ATP-binding protein [Acidobacteria bacterium]|nr:ATP-binding protein [Acidobacteriota bacterium]